MANQHDKSSGSHGHGGHHVVPLKVYYSVWIMLLIFTVITVAISYVDFGPLNMVIAMLVATMKAGMVMAFFMGLKYDSAENSVTFLSSIAFLGIFVTLTACDIFWRIPHDAAAIDASALAQASGPVDVKKLAAGSADMMAKGKTLFGQNCAVCHGAGGQGDGPGGVALNPKPRNFTVESGWKNGRKISGIVKTLNEGIKGSGMAAYSGLPVEDRFALAHYVQSLGPKVAPDTEAELNALGLNKAAGKPELEVTEAMAKAEAGLPAAQGDVAYHYEPGVAPRKQYCNLPAQWRPKWCDTNPTQPAAQ